MRFAYRPGRPDRPKPAGNLKRAGRCRETIYTGIGLYGYWKYAWRREHGGFFTEALLSEKTGRIPEAFDWFAPLIGNWDCDYYDEPEKGVRRHVAGEWIFRRILEGTGVQDVFIFPSRSTKETDPQPDGEYGTSLRMFNREKGWYDVVYTCERCMKRLTFRKEGDRLVGEVLDEKGAFWIFSGITPDRFRWENVRIREDGSRELVCEIIGKRIG